MFIFYVNYHFVYPIILEKGKPLKSVSYLILLIASGVILDNVLKDLIQHIIPYTHEHKHGGRMRREDLTFVRYLLQALNTLPPLFLSAMFKSSLLLRKKKEESLILQNRVIEAESKALKSQINPHFLFNTLNNIYSLAQTGSEKTGLAIHQLSDMLRYVIYDGSSKYVSLKDELAYIESYIKLQLLKDEDINNVKYNICKADPKFKVAPMLLIPFIENSFKHSNFEDTEKGWINVTITLDEGKLTMICNNSSPERTMKKDVVGGIGLENVKKRLELIYPDKHKLDIIKGKSEFQVKLLIDLNED